MNRNLWHVPHVLTVAGLGLCVVGVIGTPSLAASDTSRPGPGLRALADGGEKKEDKGEKVAPDKLPKKVVDSVKKDMPGSRITKAFKKTEDGKPVYLLDNVKVGKKGWDVKVAEDGTILKKEECHDDD